MTGTYGLSRRDFVKGMSVLGAVAVSNVVLGSAVARADDAAQGWVGDPDAIIAANNPYLSIAELNVNRALAKTTTRDANEVFWLAWAATAPESKRRADTEIRALAISEVDRLSSIVKDAFWDLLSCLESVRLFRRSGLVPEDQISVWLERLRKWVQWNYDTNTAATDWWAFAPNTLHQSSAILQLGYLLMGDESWKTMAKGLVVKAGKYQESDGAFRYIRESGPSSIYFGFDSTFLGRYYQLSRDSLAREQLTKMARWSADVLKNGLIEGSSAPFWKHHWATDGPSHGPEVLAGVAGDALTRSVAQNRLSLSQRFYYSYIPMYFWDGSLASNLELGADLTRYNTNIGGPQLRRGAWQVVMPGKAYADTAVGITVATGATKHRFEGILKVAALPIMSKTDGLPYADFGSLMMLPAEEMNRRATIVADDVIAIGSTFQPRYPFYGDAVAPDPRGWSITQVWIGTGEFLAGWILVRANRMNQSGGGPRGLVRVGHPITITDPDQRTFTSGELTLKAWGSQISGISAATQTPFMSEGNNHHAWLDFAGAGPRNYRAGESFGYGLSVVRTGQQMPQLDSLPGFPRVLAASIRPASGGRMTLLFNPNASTQTVEMPSAPEWVVRSQNDPTQEPQRTRWTGSVLINPNGMVMLQSGN